METSEVFSYVIVGGLLLAAAVPLIGILFTSGRKKSIKRNQKLEEGSLHG